MTNVRGVPGTLVPPPDTVAELVSMREASRQISIRMPARVDGLLNDLVQEGIFSNRTEAIVEAVLRLYEDLTVTESEVNLRLRLTTGDNANLRRLAQLDGGSVELWAERLINQYSLPHAKLLAEQADDWEAVFEKKRPLEERTESLAELQKR
ncbi:MAG: ribbon-helix-helix domain-containing protein [Candidatus Thermoplasmatota archaeon]|nr:ribbon-helix-helix domain-containing protein [Candidatus Thermoplasmatota archaeon]